jgi:hypothetical protein
LNNHAITLTVPDEVYDQALEIAEATDQPIEDVLVQYLEESFMNPLARLPRDEQSELNALQFLSEDALWTIAREQMPQQRQDRMKGLMDRNTKGTITPEEYKELEQLVEQGQRLMLRKATASGILMDRGHRVTFEDMSPQDE